MTLRERIMTRAVHIRLRNGEALKEILASYPALTETERTHIQQAVKTQMEH